jgi:hypothetical protein
MGLDYPDFRPPEYSCPACDMTEKHEPGCPYEGQSIRSATTYAELSCPHCGERLKRLPGGALFCRIHGVIGDDEAVSK